MDEADSPNTEPAADEATEQPGTESEEAFQGFPLPPATFDFLILSLRSQAEIQLGLLHFGDDKDRPKPNLPLARHTIDLLAMLSEKTKGNLDIEEQRMLENSLTELRFRFIQVSEGGAS